MNTIKIPFQKMDDICSEYEQDADRDIAVEYFVFNEFKLIISDFSYEYRQISYPLFVRMKNGTVSFEFDAPCIIDNKKLDFYTVRVDGYELDYPEPSTIGINYQNKEDVFHSICNYVELIRYLTHYIMTYQRDRKEKHSVPRKYSREHRISTSQNKVYLLDDIVKYVYDNYVPQGGTHNIQCECWGVRGHYRTYKSGKKIWINAFKKGKKRNETEPKDKTYYLSKGAIV